ncbi:MAG: peroxidase family protein [Burkholderiaceae bacterium]
MRGGANGARIRLAPQKDWEGQPAGRTRRDPATAGVRKEFNAASGRKKVSLADLIVLGGCAGVEQAAKQAGHDVKVPSPGRTDVAGTDRRGVVRRPGADRGWLPQLRLARG